MNEVESFVWCYKQKWMFPSESLSAFDIPIGSEVDSDVLAILQQWSLAGMHAELIIMQLKRSIYK